MNKKRKQKRHDRTVHDHAGSAPQSGGAAANGAAPLGGFALRLHMLSDWHVGTGGGRPRSVDRLMTRDADGLPCIPAKTLKGIWRDACEQAAFALDNGDPAGQWQQYVFVVFGDQPARRNEGAIAPTGPRAGIIALRLAQLPSPLREAVAVRPDLRAALTLVKPGIAIDPRTGAAREDFLHFDEYGRAGLVLEMKGEISPLGDPQANMAASALLIAGLSLIERLGGRRRRGAGRCRVELCPPAAGAAWAQWLRANPPPAAPAPPTPDCLQLQQNGSAIDGDWLEIPLLIDLVEPVSIASATVGNVVESLDFIPGTFLLPELTRRLGPEVATWIRDGRLIVLPATPEVAGGRGLPAPMALFLHKDGGRFDNPSTIVNRLAEPPPRDGEGGEIQLRPVRNRYLKPIAGGGTVPPISADAAAMIARTHSTIDEASQRPTEKVGGVYTFEAIPAGTRLRSALRLPAMLGRDLAGSEPEWWRRLDGPWRLGRSKSTDYGGAAVKAGPAAALGRAPDQPRPGFLTVWLLSDTLLRDAALQPAPTAAALAAELAGRLAVDLELRPMKARGIATEARIRRLESWHTRWVRPRPSLVALQAGSCFAFAVRGEIDRDRLAALEAAGIGERRAEGYGQLRFDDPLLAGSLHDWKPGSGAAERPSETDPARLARGSDWYDTARQIERVAWRKAILDATDAIAAHEAKRRKHLGFTASQPRGSQIGALRQAVRRSLTLAAGDPERVAEGALAWLNHLRETGNRASLWPSGSLDKIAHLLTEAEAIWEALQISADRLVITVDGEDALRQELRGEAILALIEAAANAHRRALERRGREAGEWRA
ncbi:MAG: RAMP superfamily CRISPR-associated protein [Stellaceae bacterium]